MPPRRRGNRAKTKVKSPRVKESSSAEDTDGSSAKEIVKQMARKYLLKSSTDTESDHKENFTGTRQTTDPYDADLETDGGATTTSDMECQTEDGQSSVLSTSQKTANRDNSEMRETSQRRTRGQRQVTTTTEKSLNKKFTTYQKQKKNTSKRKSDSDRKSRCSQTDSESDVSSQSTQKNDSNAMQQSDSGFFISPLNNRHLGKLPKMNASDTSTPSSAVGCKSLDDSCFGFDNIMSPQGLPFSPVNRVSPGNNRRCSPMSDLSSLQGSMASGSSSILSPPPKRKYDNVGYSGLIPSDQAEQHIAKKPKRKKTQQVTKHDLEWASKMSAEFDDIDMYELTIEG